MRGPALAVEGVGHRYGSKVALSDVSLELHPGERLILLGPNGAGKTTLFGLLTQLLVLREGCIVLGGHPWGSASARGQLGVVFQPPTLDLDLTVRQNLHYHGALHGLSRAEVGARTARTLPALSLEDRLDEKVRALNGGHRRRVEIVRALLHRPPVLLLDEPTVGLDVPSRRALVDHVTHLVGRERLAVLWATHLIDEVSPTDRVLVLHEGKVRAEGAPAELMAQTGARDLEGAFVALTPKGEGRR